MSAVNTPLVRPHDLGRATFVVRIIIVGTIVAAVGFQVGWQHQAMAFLSAGAMGLLAIAALEVDLPTGWIALLPAALLAAVGVVLGDVERALIGVGSGALAGALVLVFRLIDKDAFAAGDIGAAVTIGVGAGWFGWMVVAVAFVLGIFINGAVAAFVLLRSVDRARRFPMVPGLVVGASIAIGLAS